MVLRNKELARPDDSQRIGNTIVVTDGCDTYTLDIFSDPGSAHQGGVMDIKPFHGAIVRQVGPDIAPRKDITSETWQGALRNGMHHIVQSLTVGVYDREEERKRRK